MTKKDIAKAIAEQVGVQQVVVTKAVQMLFDDIIEVLVSEGRIELRNFGVFMVRKKGATSGRNPRTGEQVSVPERCVVRFKAGREMVKKVAGCPTSEASASGK